MKAKLLIVVLLSFLMHHSVIANGYYNYKGEQSYPVQKRSYQSPPVYKKVCGQEYSCSNSYQNNCEQSCGCGGYSCTSCSCSDPTCFSGNPCLSPGKCCQSFGNIGSGDFDPICPCGS